MRKFNFENDKYYHIYNRGVDKREIFLDENDFGRSIVSMREFNAVLPIGSLYLENLRKKIGAREGVRHPIGCRTPKPPLILFITYCLNPNHYHFIVKQIIDGGISEFMKRLSGGYTNYFNKRYNRSGALFQGKFKAKEIDSSKYLDWCSAYVNGNIEIHKIFKAKNYHWSSHKDYLNLRNGTLCDKIAVMNEFNGDVGEYESFVENVVRDCQERKEAVEGYLKELE